MSDSKSFDDVNKKSRRNRKKRELALLLPIIGIILLLTPILTTFITDSETSALIDALLFIFCVWAILITAAFILSRILVSEIRDE